MINSRVENELRLLTIRVCNELEGIQIPTKSVWTIATQDGSPPYVALDPEKPDHDSLRMSTSIALLHMPEYEALAGAIEADEELSQGILVDAGGYLALPERVNITRAFATNFLWDFFDDGLDFSWDESRFEKTLDLMKDALAAKSVVFHTIIPLSSLRIEVDQLGLGDEFTLKAASTKELERWLNPNRALGPIVDLPSWNSRHVDKPAVLHSRLTVKGIPHPISGFLEDHIKGADPHRVVTALRLAFRSPILILFHQDDNEGLLCFGGGGTSWNSIVSPTGSVATLKEENVAEVTTLWSVLQKRTNLEKVAISLRRWESSLLRTSLEDQLIDHWIGLEALLLVEEEGELKFRIAMRLAELLAETGAERQAIYSRTLHSYDWRSAIVHGSVNRRRTRLEKKGALPEVVQKTNEDLRSAVLKVLLQETLFDPATLESGLLGRS